MVIVSCHLPRSVGGNHSSDPSSVISARRTAISARRTVISARRTVISAPSCSGRQSAGGACRSDRPGVRLPSPAARSIGTGRQPVGSADRPAAAAARRLCCRRLVSLCHTVTVPGRYCHCPRETSVSDRLPLSPSCYCDCTSARHRVPCPLPCCRVQWESTRLW